jgi:hypothetical protein
MFRPLSLVLTAAALTAAPLAAKDAGPYYHAQLAQPATKGQVIAGGVLWMCEGADCFAAKGTARPAVMCKRLAEAASPVTSFTFGGEALDADDLAACNR